MAERGVGITQTCANAVSRTNRFPFLTACDSAASSADTTIECKEAIRAAFSACPGIAAVGGANSTYGPYFHGCTRCRQARRLILTFPGALDTLSDTDRSSLLADMVVRLEGRVGSGSVDSVVLSAGPAGGIRATISFGSAVTDATVESTAADMATNPLTVTYGAGSTSLTSSSASSEVSGGSGDVPGGAGGLIADATAVIMPLLLSALVF